MRIAVPKNFLPDYPYKEDIGAGTGLRDEKLAPWPRTEYAVKVHRQEYYALITHTDAQIGKILDALREVRQGRQHVHLLHRRPRPGRRAPWPAGQAEHVRTQPAAAVDRRRPGHRRRASSIDTPVYLQDIMPTTLELARSPIPRASRIPQPAAADPRRAEQQYEAIYGAYRDDMQRMVLQDDDKLIYYPKIDKTLLFNLGQDPLEMKIWPTVPAGHPASAADRTIAPAAAANGGPVAVGRARGLRP